MTKKSSILNFISRLFPRKINGQVLYTEALECLLTGDMDEALWKLRELVKIDTNHISAYIILGDILRGKKKPDQAVKIHQSLTFRRGLTADKRIEIYTSLAKDYYALGDFSRAEENANRVFQLDKKNRWAAEYLIQICEEQERWADASEYLKKLEKVSEKSATRRHAFYRMMEGRAKEKESLHDDARADYIKATKLDATYADPYLYLGNLDEQGGNLGKAVENWEKFAEVSPGSGRQVFARLEKALFELGRFGQMEDFYRKLMKKDSENMDVISGLVNVLQAKGEFDQALTLIDEVISKNNKSIQARLAHLKLSLRKIDQDQLSSEVDEIVQLIHRSKGNSSLRSS